MIDTSTPVRNYKVLMSELLGYYLTVPATSAEQAMESAQSVAMQKHYIKSEIMVVETAVVSAYEVTK